MPSDREVAEELGLSMADFQATVVEASAATGSVDRPLGELGDGESTSLIDRLTDPNATDVSTRLERQQLYRALVSPGRGTRSPGRGPRMQPLNRRTGLPLILALGLLLPLAGPAAPAHANGNPVSIVLSYLTGVSNWGPTNATGLAELVPEAGDVRVTAAGLPRLQGEQYEVWLTNTASGEKMALGAFNAGDDSVGKLEVVLSRAIPDRGWDLLFLSVEADGSRPSEPGPRHAIAGRFAVPPGSEGQPAELPKTGGPPAAQPPGAAQTGGGPTGSLPLIFYPAVAGFLISFLLIGLVVGLSLGRRRSRRRTP